MRPPLSTKRIWTGKVRFASGRFGKIQIEIEVCETHSTSPFNEWKGENKWILLPNTREFKDALIRKGIFVEDSKE